jgi:multiple sugar transport system substrate-binding protein
MRKSFSVISLFLIAIFIFSCGKSKSNNGEIELVFWHSFVPATQAALKELISKFESENPGIKIKAQYVPTGDALVQKLIASIQSKTTPDIAWIHSDFLDKLVEGDAIFEMNRFINGSNGLSENEMNDFFPELIKSAKLKNNLYALPMEATTLALLYNKTLFKEAGLNTNHPPQNWAELFDYSKKLTIDKNNDGKIDQYGFYIPVFPASGQLSVWMVLQWEPFVWQAGGSLINESQTKVLFNSEAGVQALSLWKNIFEMMDFGKFTLSHDMAFSSGTLAMVMDGPWNLPLYRKIKNFEWGITSLPEGPKSRVTYLAGEHLAIFKQSKYPDVAWKFLKWFTQPENQALFSMKSGYLPVRKSTLELPDYKKFLESDLYMKSFVEQISIGRARSAIDKHKVEINQLIAEAVENAILGNKNPKKVLDEEAIKANQLLKTK